MTCECGNISERNGKCASCNRKQRQAEKLASQPPKKQKAIAKQSDKMVEAFKIYLVKKRDFLKANPVCEVYKDRPSVDVHHMKGRNTIELLLDDNCWLAVSREAHQKIELNPEWAKEKGYSLSRLANTEQEPHKI